jgi:hypothetical protein
VAYWLLRDISPISPRGILKTNVLLLETLGQLELESLEGFTTEDEVEVEAKWMAIHRNVADGGRGAKTVISRSVSEDISIHSYIYPSLILSLF